MQYIVLNNTINQALNCVFANVLGVNTSTVASFKLLT